VCCRRRGAEYRIVGLGGGKFVARVRRQSTHIRVDRARNLAKGHRTVGAGDRNLSTFGDKIGCRCFEQMRSRIEHLLAQRARSKRCRAAGEHKAPAGIGAGATRHGCTVTLYNADILETCAEVLGDDLRQRGLQPLSVRGDAERRQ
jgi:hypothetical protein